MGKRVQPTGGAEASVLIKSRRVCCVCYAVLGDGTPKAGQVAHLDRDSSNSIEENLAWLCLFCHSAYDSKSLQSKGYQPAEVKAYRKLVHDAVAAGLLPSKHYPNAPVLDVEIPDTRLFWWSRKREEWLLTVYIRAANIGESSTGIRRATLHLPEPGEANLWIPRKQPPPRPDGKIDPLNYVWHPIVFDDTDFLNLGPNQFLPAGGCAGWTACFKCSPFLPPEHFTEPQTGKPIHLEFPLELDLIPVRGVACRAQIQKIRLAPSYLDGP